MGGMETGKQLSHSMKVHKAFQDILAIVASGKQARNGASRASQSSSKHWPESLLSQTRAFQESGPYEAPSAWLQGD